MLEPFAYDFMQRAAVEGVLMGVVCVRLGWMTWRPPSVERPRALLFDRFDRAPSGPPPREREVVGAGRE